jgi:chaperonin cofactor prefoldin
MARKPVRRLSQSETVKLHEVLKQHLTLLPKINENDPQLCEFEKGWDDERCAKEIDAELTEVHASNLRVNLFGRLFVKAADNRLDALEEQMKVMAVKFAELTLKHDKLCTAIAVNRIIDVRHLRIERQN